MASSLALLTAIATLFSCAHAWSPDQCNVTSYGAPDKAACNTLLTDISKLGVGNTSYLFIPTQLPTPDGISNATRKNFPESWSNSGCRAALVPIAYTEDLVTYDTTTYKGIAKAGSSIVQNCVSNGTGSGGWELAGDDENLVLHLYASGSEIDQAIRNQTGLSIAVTAEETIDDAELDDPRYNGTYEDASNATFAGNGTGTGAGGVSASGTGTAAATQTTVATPTTAASVASQAPAVAAQVVQGPGTFDYFGCAIDSADSRTLSSLSWSGTDLTVQRCADYCSKYQYMGVEFGSECYCGGDASAQGSKPATIVTGDVTTNCTTPCNGDPTQLCGGTGWMNLYQNRNSATAGQPTA